MVLLDNLILLILLTLLAAASQFLSLKLEKKLIPSLAAALFELAAVIILLYRGADLEELFLMLLVFGAVSVTVYYRFGDKKEKLPEEKSEEVSDK